MICLDSSTLIDLLKNKKEAVKKIEEIHKEDIATTRINIFEILLGVFIKKGKDKQKFSERIKSLLEKIKIMELDELSCVEAAKIKSELMIRGEEIETSDCLIAGIMLANGCSRIITWNVDHFNRIEEIKVEGY